MDIRGAAGRIAVRHAVGVPGDAAILDRPRRDRVALFQAGADMMKITHIVPEFDVPDLTDEQLRAMSSEIDRIVMEAICGPAPVPDEAISVYCGCSGIFHLPNCSAWCCT